MAETKTELKYLHPDGTANIQQHSDARGLRSSEENRDEATLARFGKRQRFKRNFGFLSITGLTCTLMLTWEGSLIGFGPQLLNGGPAGLFGGFLFAWIGTFFQTLVMAELASMSDTFERRTVQLATVFYLSASSVQTLAIINNPSYVPQRWQVTLLMYALMAFAFFVNTYLGRLLPKVEALILVLHVFGFFVVLIVLVYLAPEKNPSSVVFGEFFNYGGWSSNGLSFLVGTVSSILSLLGVDAAAHLAEEIQNASTVVPVAMISTIVINGSTGFGMIIAVLFCAGPITTVIKEYLQGELPFAAAFVSATGSKGGAVGLAIPPVLVGICGSIGVLATASRMVWAFARENALPGSKTLAKIEPRRALPIFAIIFTGVINLLLALIEIGSTAAYNAFAGLTVQGFYTVFVIVACVSLHKKLTTPSSDIVYGPFRLGFMGIPITIVALAYTLVGLTFSFWPPTTHPSLDEFNWAVVVYGASILSALVYYQLQARHVYTGPIVERPVE
ncbi:MAG: hypothetical protein M1828_003511 [Chrysothrix sp. TS-e1954]|nr:MAG: hypothetical protein M1828_003511 [Chrysothrix sp. TS-e1954]